MTIQGRPFSAYGGTVAEAVANLEEKVMASGHIRDTRTYESYLLTSYLQTIQGTQQKHQDNVRDELRYISFKHRPLHEITRHDVQMLINTMAKKGYAWNTIRRVRSTIVSVFDLAETDGLLKTSNPASKTKLPPKPKGESALVEFLTAVELHQLIAAADEKGSAALNALILTGLLGIGWEEARILEPRHFEDDAVTVPGAKTAYRYRKLPLPSLVKPFLSFNVWPLIPVSDSSTLQAINRVARPLGLGSVGRNILRHTCSTGLQSIGCDRETREMILGHRPESSTAIYSHDPMMRKKRLYLEAWVEHVLHSPWVNCWVQDVPDGWVRATNTA